MREKYILPEIIHKKVVINDSFSGLTGKERRQMRKLARQAKEDKGTANQLFKKFKDQTGSKIDFKGFLDKAKESGFLEKVIDKVYAGKEEEIKEDVEKQDKKEKKGMKILGMPPIVVYTGGAVLIAAMVFGIYKLIPKKKKSE